MPTMKSFACLTLGLLLASTSLEAQIDVERTISIGRNAIHFQDYIVSMGYFNQVISLRPWMAEPYFYRAVAKISLDDFAGAEEDASLALERNPIFPRAYLLRGIARYNRQDYKQATEDFRRGLELSPQDQGMLYNLAIALLGDKQIDEAEKAARELLRLDRKSKDAYRLIAQTALERKDTLAVQGTIDTLLTLDSTYQPALLLRAQLASDKKDYPTAIRALDRVLRLEPSQADLYVHRAILHYHQRNLRGAMQDYSEALRLNPNERTALNNRALLRSQVGEYRLAIQDWSKLLQLDSTLHIARYNRGLLYLRTNNYTAAVKDFDQVLQRYPAFAAGFVARAEARQRLGDIKGATRDQIHLYDLQTNKGYRDRMNASGRQPASTPETRSEQDEAIEKYHMLIESPAVTAKEKPQYTSQVRGRVQDEQAQSQPRADLILTYFAELNKEGNQGQVHFAPLLDRFNIQQLKKEGSLRLHFREAGTALSREEAQLIQQHLDGQRSLSSTDAEASFLCGIDAFLLQDVEQAITFFSKALELNPRFALARLARASALLRRNEIAQSSSPSGTPQLTPLADLNEVIQQTPDLAQAYYNRANLYAKSGATAQARRDYDQALRLNRSFAEAYFNRGLLSYSEGKLKEGTSDLSRAGELGLYQAYGLIKRMNK